MADLRAGLIGLGMMGRHHARVLGTLEGVELVAVADPAGDHFGAAKGRLLLSSVSELIDQGIDYCVVAVPTGSHEDVALELADAGVHALIEKPLAHDSQSARRIFSAFTERGLIGGVGHIERYNAALQQARMRIAQGDLGEIYQVATRRQGPFPGRIADVGVVKDLATHDFDLTSWVTQQFYTSVSAQTGHKSGRVHEDLVAVIGQLDNGTVTSHLVNWLSPLKERSTIITGELGTFVADTLTADLTFYGNGSVPTTWDEISRFRGVSEGDVLRYAFQKPEPLRIEHENFRDAVKGAESDIVNFKAGLEVVKVAEAVIRSSATSEVVHLDPLSR
ncbi:Gfo/Idh/MocA family protein [Dietzia sp. ANT_WB102]|uniref:Gfo/Idh/MocA family protein n=1 Tax=Dietzia sp. ANT_WB102 TaxID=2597345 RepID=UPI0011EE7316|nr:Gfo/Idh/MocA family oxidoreductase [Dietzia sp. ANT_WB102]KAA0918897.1 Gfo/Idh/MocA family oxidoreductase [Dietzia sp. ANT_WB102]